MKQGWTLVETLVALAILIALAAVVYPLIGPSKREAAIARSTAQLRQFGVALNLYRQDWDQGGASDIVARLGLPPGALTFYKAARIPRAMWHTGGTKIGPGADVYTWIAPEPGKDIKKPSFADWYAIDGESVVPMLDETHGNGTQPRAPGFFRRFVLGLHLDGHVSRRRDYGDYTSYEWWCPALRRRT